MHRRQRASPIVVSNKACDDAVGDNVLFIDDDGDCVLIEPDYEAEAFAFRIERARRMVSSAAEELWDDPFVAEAFLWGKSEALALSSREQVSCDGSNCTNNRSRSRKNNMIKNKKEVLTVLKDNWVQSTMIWIRAAISAGNGLRDDHLEIILRGYLHHFALSIEKCKSEKLNHDWNTAQQRFQPLIGGYQQPFQKQQQEEEEYCQKRHDQQQKLQHRGQQEKQEQVPAKVDSRPSNTSAGAALPQNLWPHALESTHRERHGESIVYCLLRKHPELAMSR